jgi:hypothetical protein
VAELHLDGIQQKVMLPVLPVCLNASQQPFGLEPAHSAPTQRVLLEDQGVMHIRAGRCNECCHDCRTEH